MTTDIAAAVRLLLAGELVRIPTETVTVSGRTRRTGGGGEIFLAKGARRTIR